MPEAKLRVRKVCTYSAVISAGCQAATLLSYRKVESLNGGRIGSNGRTNQ